jgi:SAM-dependent methyltransferase
VHNVVIQGPAYKYLCNQRGEFDHLRSSPAEWYAAYHAEMQKTIGQLGFWCPAPRTVLDIGSGLGVVDMLIMKEVAARCVLVDGEDEDGEAKKYDVPFCAREVVQQFMSDNQAPELWSYVNPDQLKDEGNFPVFDLVLSFRSWCFHYAPEVYMSFVQRHVAPESRVIIDVRSSRIKAGNKGTFAAHKWRQQLHATWKENYVVEEGEKFDRMCYVVGGRRQ